MNRIRFASCLAITVIFVIGCASSINVRGINPKIKQTDNYNIGVEQRKTVGEPMLSKESLIYYPGFILKDNLQPPSTIIGSSMMIPKGAKWECKWQDENTNMLCHNPIYAYPYSSIIYLVVDNAYILKANRIVFRRVNVNQIIIKRPNHRLELTAALRENVRPRSSA